jgi:hypothetical protein
MSTVQAVEDSYQVAVNALTAFKAAVDAAEVVPQVTTAPVVTDQTAPADVAATAGVSDNQLLAEAPVDAEAETPAEEAAEDTSNVVPAVDPNAPVTNG